jgi:hypothetical protein
MFFLASARLRTVASGCALLVCWLTEGRDRLERELRVAGLTAVRWGPSTGSSSSANWSLVTGALLLSTKDVVWRTLRFWSGSAWFGEVVLTRTSSGGTPPSSGSSSGGA